MNACTIFRCLRARPSGAISRGQKRHSVSEVHHCYAIPWDLLTPSSSLTNCPKWKSQIELGVVCMKNSRFCLFGYVPPSSICKGNLKPVNLRVAFFILTPIFLFLINTSQRVVKEWSGCGWEAVDVQCMLGRWRAALWIQVITFSSWGAHDSILTFFNKDISCPEDRHIAGYFMYLLHDQHCLANVIWDTWIYSAFHYQKKKKAISHFLKLISQSHSTIFGPPW